MARGDQLTLSLGDHIKQFLFKTNVGAGILVVGGLSLMGIAAASPIIIDHYFSETKEIIQQNAIGNAQPDVYIEKDGIKYFSHIDGKDISDLVKP